MKFPFKEGDLIGISGPPENSKIICFRIVSIIKNGSRTVFCGQRQFRPESDIFMPIHKYEMFIFSGKTFSDKKERKVQITYMGDFE